MNTKTMAVTAGRSFLWVFPTMAVTLAACQPPTTASDMDEMGNRAGELASRFVNTLQPTLQQAMGEGGPVHAITVCSDQAPQIAANLTRESGWEVTRVSLQPRNASAASPDEWERSVLEQFQQRQRRGEPGAELRASEAVNGEFRYMQAQPTGPLCLTCHGQDISADVRSALAEHYPDDKATGYGAGEIRGAISLRTEL